MLLLLDKDVVIFSVEFCDVIPVTSNPPTLLVILDVSATSVSSSELDGTIPVLFADSSTISVPLTNALRSSSSYQDF